MTDLEIITAKLIELNVSYTVMVLSPDRLYISLGVKRIWTHPLGTEELVFYNGELWVSLSFFSVSLRGVPYDGL